MLHAYQFCSNLLHPSFQCFWLNTNINNHNNNCTLAVYINVYVWELYSIKIHFSHPFIYQYLHLPIAIMSAIEFKRKRYGWMKEISNNISFFFNCCYLGVLSFVSLHTKRDIDHTFKIKTKTKRANLTKTKHSVSFIV